MEQNSVVSIENRTLTPDEIGLLASLIADEPDHYTVLGVDRNASPEEIKAAYCLAVEYFHPLKSGKITESDSVMHWKLSAAFARIKEAFTVLSGGNRRKVYEPTQSAWPDRAVPQAQLRRNADSRQRSQSERSPAGRIQPDAAVPQAQVHRNADSRRRSLGERSPAGRMPHGGAVPQAQSHRNVDSRKPSQGDRSPAGRTHQGAAQNRTAEMRKEKQVPVNLPLRVVFGRHWQEVTEATDVTGLGTRFRLSRRVEPGTLLRLEMSMPKHLRTRAHDDELYVVNAFVIYANQDDSGGDVFAEFV
ncbi:MAG TPA: J domain-containing protein [Blastocatellia bacterium]|nr:J domain-containing protein [Blastocatellia bacterium]